MLFDPKFIVDAVLFHGTFSEIAIPELEKLQKERYSLKYINGGIEPAFVFLLKVSNLL